MAGAGRIARFRRVISKEDVRSLSRRYFVANGFDGTLTCIGVVVGAYLSGVTDGFAIIGIGLGAAVGLGVSGIWAVWEIERAETSMEQRELETAMLTDLSNTRITRELQTEQIVLALAAASGPVIGIFLTLTPFLLVDVFLSPLQALLASIGLGIALLGGVGAYLGIISEQRPAVGAIRMGLAGVVVAVISILLPG